MKKLKKEVTRKKSKGGEKNMEIPNGYKVIFRGEGIAIALGEVTGHAHRVLGNGCLLEAPNGQRFFAPAAPTKITHEEHGLQDLAEGLYRIDAQQELSLSEEWQKVVD